MKAITQYRLIFCKDCGSKESWERYQPKDMLYANKSGIYEYCYRCKICGKLTWYPYQPELKAT